MTMKPFFFFSLILPLIFISCISSRKASASIGNLPDSLPALPSTEIDLPLKISAKPILFKANFFIPAQFTSDGWPNYAQPTCDFRYKYRFVRSGFRVTCANNVLGIQLSGNYQVAGAKCICSMNKSVSPWVSGSCGFGKEPLRRVNISISSKLNFLSNYKVSTTSSLAKLDPLDKCYVSLFSNDVTDEVLDSISASIKSFCSTLDATISGMDFSRLVKGAAEKGFHKTAISKYGFLLIKPSVLRIGQLNYDKDSFYISIGLSCKPELSSDSTNKITAIPSLIMNAGENRNAVAAYVNAAYDYDFMSKLLSDTLRDKVFYYKGRTIVIKDAAIKGLGDHQVEVRIDFVGTNKGRLYLRGTPILDTAKQSLTIPDISYSLESKDLALKIGKSLFRNKIKRALNGGSYLDIAALVKSNMHLLDSVLNRSLGNGVSLSGKMNELKITGLLAQKKVLQVQIYAKANLELTSNGNL
jgi:Domain of unknown function (DUF4403)